MDDTETDKYNMVKMTLKRADDATEDEKWVCKRIYDETESAPAIDMEHEADNSSAKDENLTNEPESAENAYRTIPSYLEIVMKESENQEPPQRNSTKNSSKIDCPTSSLGNINKAAMSINDPLDLSTNHSKLESQRDVTNFSSKSPPTAHTSQGKFLANAGRQNVPGLTGTDRMIQGVPIYYLPGAAWPQNIPPTVINEQINPGKTPMVTMAMPSTGYNFTMNAHVTNMMANTENQGTPMKGNIFHHMSQDTQRHQKKANYDSCSNEPQNTSQSLRWPSGLEGDGNTIPIRNVLTQKISDNFANIQLKNATNNLKRLHEHSAQIGTNNASKSTGPPMKRKSIDQPSTHFCSVCGENFKSEKSYDRHLLTKKHLKKANHIAPRKSDFQPNFVSEPSEQRHLQAHSLPSTQVLQSMQFQMWQHLQAQAMTPHQILDHPNQYFNISKVINNVVNQNYGVDASKVNYDEESSSQLRSQNLIGKDCYPQNTRVMNLPFSNPQRMLLPPNLQAKTSTMALENESHHPSPSQKKISQIQPGGLIGAKYLHNSRLMITPNSHVNSPQGFLLPTNSQSINSMVSNPNNLESRTPHPSGAHKDISVQNQSEGLNSGAQSVTHQEDSFRFYHCMVCSIFKTNSWDELELHVFADRNRTPFELVIASAVGLVCKLCDFRSTIPTEMAQHCTSRTHLDKVSYYNHLREGGNFRIADVFKDIHKPFWVFCAACEYAAETMRILQLHRASRSHLFNVDCCMYIESFSTSVEYFACIPCNVKTYTKGDLLVHVRSGKHKKVLEKCKSGNKTFHEPREIFYIKEMNEPSQIMDQNSANTFMAIEEKNEVALFADNQSSIDSASSSSSKTQPVSCPLCQQVFPKISILEQHLQVLHGVNEDGVKWLVSATTKVYKKVHEAKSKAENELTDAEKRKVKSSTFWPEVSSAENEKLLKISSDSSSHQGSIIAEPLVAINQSLNQNGKIFTSSIKKFNEFESKINESNQNENPTLNPCETKTTVRSGQEFYETESMQNADIVDQNPEANSCGSFSDRSLNQEFHETETRWNADILDQSSRVNPRGRSSLDCSLSHEFLKTEGMHKVDKLDQSFRVNSRIRSYTDHTLKQDFNETKGMRNSELNQESKTNTNSTSRQQFCESKNRLPAAVKRVPNSEERNNLDSSHHDITVANDVESGDDSLYVIETDVSSSGLLSSTDTGSLISHSVFNTSRESNDSWSNDDISEQYERLQALEKPIASARRSMVIDCPLIQHDPLDSENSKLSLDCQPNLGLKRDEVNNSPIKNLETFVDSKLKDDISISGKIENSDNLVIDLNDYPNESEEQFCIQNSPSETDPQKEAEKSIENIEISGVFSLQGHIHHSSNNTDGDETPDFDIYSDL